MTVVESISDLIPGVFYNVADVTGGVAHHVADFFRKSRAFIGSVISRALGGILGARRAFLAVGLSPLIDGRIPMTRSGIEKTLLG